MRRGPLTRSLAKLVETEMERLGVPGLSVGVVHGDNTETWSFGVTNVEFGQPIDDRTLFLIASTSKTFTATTLVILAEAGVLDLDAPVREYIPRFAVPDETAAAAARVRDLVSHHLGWNGDYFDDFGRGTDAIRRYVARMKTRVPQVTPFGEAFSYNNAAFAVAGRVIEVVAGQPFEEVVAERIFEPLGLDDTFYFPEDIITRKHALGHVPVADGLAIVRPFCGDRSSAPDGGIASTVHDLLSWARFHMGDGRAANSTRVLSARALRSMQQTVRPAGSMCQEVGFSWLISTLADGSRLVGHGGAFAGQMSAFQMVPKRRFAVACLTNGDRGALLHTQVVDWALREVLDTSFPVDQRKPPKDLAQYAGVYRPPLGGVLELTVDGDGLVATHHLPPSVADDPDQMAALPPSVRLEFTGRDRGEIVGETSVRWFEFLRGSNDKIAFLRWRGRLAPRRDDIVLR